MNVVVVVALVRDSGPMFCEPFQFCASFQDFGGQRVHTTNTHDSHAHSLFKPISPCGEHIRASIMISMRITTVRFPISNERAWHVGVRVCLPHYLDTHPMRAT
jgi:hypothetical protein